MTTFKRIISLFVRVKSVVAEIGLHLEKDCNYADSSVGGRFSGGKYSLVWPLNLLLNLSPSPKKD